MRERYGDPPEPKSGVYQVDVTVSYQSTLYVVAADPDEASERATEMVQEDHPHADVEVGEHLYCGPYEEEAA